MSKLTFWGRFLLSDNSGAVGLPFEKMAWATDGVDQHDKNVLVVRGLFVCSPFVLGELALCKVLERLLFVKRVTESPIMSDCL